MATTGQTVRLGPATSPTPPECGAAIGDLIGGRFRLGAVVGHGGQAVVFQAADQLRPGIAVAVKVARRDLKGDARAEAEAALRWEGGLLRRLRHRALPRIQAMESGPKLTWLARDLIPGTPLPAATGHGPLEPRLVVSLARQLCELLCYLHTREVPVVVSDLKPANLILRPDQTLALIDLGAAITMARRPPRQPRPRHGTPGYAPPEQLADRGHDERADIFALAVTCYELLTGLDPAAAPLQLDLARLDRAAPRLAPALRSALAMEVEQRCPTAAVLAARIGTSNPAQPLLLGGGVALADGRDLSAAVQRSPQLVGPAVADGSLERWLAAHPDATLGRLRYALRAAHRVGAGRLSPLDTLLSAMAPSDGSPLLQFAPGRIVFGDIPLRSWRIWSRPAALTLHNPALTPLRWELNIPAQRDAEVRALVAGKYQRVAAGVVAPGERIRVELVARAAAGARSGSLQLRCGNHSWAIPWEASASAGIAVGGRHVGRLEDLDLGRAELVPALEALLADGSLMRWLRATGRKTLAVELEAALSRGPDELGRRLLVGRVLHELDPTRFPLLRVRGLELAARPITAGEPTYTLVELDNLGVNEVALHCRSHTPWAEVAAAPALLAPLATGHLSLRLTPPAGMRGSQPVALGLEVGALPLQLVVPIQVTPERWWQRLRRIITG